MIEKADELQQECEENLEIETITVSSAQGNLQIVSYDAEEIQAKGVEVANGKPVSTNDDVAEGRAKNAVDGMITDNSSWITSQNQSGYWLEIDLQAEYALIGADLYTGKMDGTYGLRDVKLQAYQNENWLIFRELLSLAMMRTIQICFGRLTRVLQPLKYGLCATMGKLGFG